MKRYLWLAAAVLSLAVSGCGTTQTRVLGTAPSAKTVLPICDLSHVKGTVEVRGVMVEKCPVSGCWFLLKDNSGVIRVDTKDGGFVVAGVPLHKEMTVQGTLQAGADRQIAATGLSY